MASRKPGTQAGDSAAVGFSERFRLPHIFNKIKDRSGEDSVRIDEDRPNRGRTDSTERARHARRRPALPVVFIAALLLHGCVLPGIKSSDWGSENGPVAAEESDGLLKPRIPGASQQEEGPPVLAPPGSVMAPGSATDPNAPSTALPGTPPGEQPQQRTGQGGSDRFLVKPEHVTPGAGATDRSTDPSPLTQPRVAQSAKNDSEFTDPEAARSQPAATPRTQSPETLSAEERRRPAWMTENPSTGSESQRKARTSRPYASNPYVPGADQPSARREPEARPQPQPTTPSQPLPNTQHQPSAQPELQPDPRTAAEAQPSTTTGTDPTPQPTTSPQPEGAPQPTDPAPGRTAGMGKKWEDQKVLNAAVKKAKEFAAPKKIKVCYDVEPDEWWVFIYDDVGNRIDLKQFVWNRNREILEPHLVLSDPIPHSRLDDHLYKKESGRACEVYEVPGER